MIGRDDPGRLRWETMRIIAMLLVVLSGGSYAVHREMTMRWILFAGFSALLLLAVALWPHRDVK